jgi:hypothetical protein
MLSAMHGAADLAAAGHLSPIRTGRVDVDDLVNDLFLHLKAAARP